MYSLRCLLGTDIPCVVLLAPPRAGRALTGSRARPVSPSGSTRAASRPSTSSSPTAASSSPAATPPSAAATSSPRRGQSRRACCCARTRPPLTLSLLPSRVTDVVLKAFEACGASYGCMNNRACCSSSTSRSRATQADVRAPPSLRRLSDLRASWPQRSLRFSFLTCRLTSLLASTSCRATTRTPSPLPPALSKEARPRRSAS